jgi:uncharacterized membrane protein YozB (DUF420 family)
MPDILLMNKVNLLAQLIIIAIFTISIFLKIRGRVRQHAMLMLAAYLLNLASLAFLMVPLFLGGLPVVDQYADQYSILFVIHHIIGLIAFVLATFLVLRYVRGGFTPKYCRGKWLMRMTAILWIVALLLGLYLYQAGFFPG